MDGSRFWIEWRTDVGHLAALEPDASEVLLHAETLAAAYNDPRNATLMGHTEAISPAEVAAHYAEIRDDGGRNFLLFRDGALVGDADLRGIEDGAAEFAFMIGAPDVQGKGLGTRYAMMIHAFAFAQLGLARVYASVVPHNTASRRVFDKLGYTLDDSAAARAYADEPGDVTLVIERATFEASQVAARGEIRIAMR